jgi:ankyrin repeat protein
MDLLSIPSDILRLIASLQDLPVKDILNFCATKELQEKVCSNKLFWAGLVGQRLTSYSAIPRKLYDDSRITIKDLQQDVAAFEKLFFPIESTLTKYARKGYDKLISKIVFDNYIGDDFNNDIVGNALIVAAEQGYLEIVNQLVTSAKLMDVGTAFNEAAANARHEIFYLLAKFLPLDDTSNNQWWGQSYDRAVYIGDTEIMQYIEDRLEDKSWLSQGIIMAVRGGHFELADRVYPYSDFVPSVKIDAIASALQLNDLQFYNYLVEKQPLHLSFEGEWYNNRNRLQLEIINYLIKWGHYDILQGLINTSSTKDKIINYSFMRAVQKNKLNIVRQLLPQVTDFEQNYVLEKAAKKGYSEMVQLILPYIINPGIRRNAINEAEMQGQQVLADYIRTSLI